MNPKVIRWGIIGAGKIASRFAEDIGSVPYSTLYGIASRNIEKAEEFKKQFKAEISYGSYEELAEDLAVDAIYIATPHSFHKAHTLLCLNHKKAVLCEKPFAMNLEEVMEMVSTARKNDTLLMEAMWTAFLPHFQYVQQLIEDKHYGKIIHLEADFGFFPEYDKTSRLFNKSIGGGSLLDIGIYPIFAALATLGKPNAIEAKASLFETGADAECNMIFKYDSSTANLKSTLLKETKTEATWTCEHGTIKINSRFHEPSTITLIDKRSTSGLKSFNYKTLGYSYEIEHFNQLIRTGKKESNIMSFNKSVELISTLDEVRRIIDLEY